MRVRLAFLAVIACGLGGGSAFADKAKAKEAAKIYSRAGEQAKVVVEVKAGQVMRIDRTDGRWLKVRVSGRTGWIPRSKVELLDDDEVARNTRRRPFVDGRSTKRGFGGQQAPADRVGADAVDVDVDVDTDNEPKPGKGTGAGKGKGKPKVTDTEDDPEDKPKPGKGKGKGRDKGKPKVTDVDPEDEPRPKRAQDDEPVIKDDADDHVVDDRPKVRVTGAAKIYTEASDESEPAEWTVKPDMVLYPTRTKGKFTEVENEEGEIGFILSSKVDTIGVVEHADEIGAPARREIDVRGRLGVTFIKQGLHSDGPKMLPDNYDLSTSAATIALGGGYLHRGKRFVVGGDVSLDVAKALPGISAPMNQTTGITLYQLDVRGVVGIDLKRSSGMTVLGRFGLRYQSYQVSDVEDLTKNTAKLPSEIVTAPTFGVALALPRLTSKIGLQLSLDTMLVGASVKQTKNLEDGSDANVKGAMANLGVTYHWKQQVDIHASYDLDYMKYGFGAPLATSMRGHTGSAITRTDLFHAFTLGIAKGF